MLVKLNTLTETQTGPMGTEVIEQEIYVNINKIQYIGKTEYINGRSLEDLKKYCWTLHLDDVRYWIYITNVELEILKSL